MVGSAVEAGEGEVEGSSEGCRVGEGDSTAAVVSRVTVSGGDMDAMIGVGELDGTMCGKKSVWLALRSQPTR